MELLWNYELSNFAANKKTFLMVTVSPVRQNFLPRVIDRALGTLGIQDSSRYFRITLTQLACVSLRLLPTF